MRILLIEEDSKGAAEIKKGLEDMNFEVENATEDGQIFSALSDSTFDLIIISSFVSAHKGFDLFNALDKKEILTPVLSIRETGATPVFEFLKNLQASLGSSENSRGAQIRFGPLVLDPVSHKVWRNQKEINLTPKEYTLLEYFIRHPNQILTRPMIANHVWNQNFDFFTNVIDVYINYLRRKLDQGHKTKLIHTVRGKGYILKEG
jgi:DNA-binding response OmpR family regulator